MTKQKKTKEERFWEKVDIGSPDSCWKWKGAKRSEKYPYGQFYENGRNRPAHAVAWELHNKKEFPKGLEGCHKCDNPSCVNPDHIFPGTHKENMADSSAKGRCVSLYSSWTHCIRGHELSGSNVYISTKGHRVCRACQNMKQREYKARIRQRKLSDI